MWFSRRGSAVEGEFVPASARGGREGDIYMQHDGHVRNKQRSVLGAGCWALGVARRVRGGGGDGGHGSTHA